MRYPIWILVCKFLLIKLSIGIAHADINIASDNIPGILDLNDKQSPYYRFIQQVNLATDENLVVDIFPPRRAGNVFDKHTADCHFPANADHMPLGSVLLQTIPFNAAKAYFFAKQPFTADFTLKNADIQYRIAFRRGVSFGGLSDNLDPHIQFGVNNIDQAFGMLEKDRVDLVLAYLPDAHYLVTKGNGDELFYKTSEPVFMQTEHIVCYRSKKTEIFINQANQVISHLIESGKLKDILGDAYLAP